MEDEIRGIVRGRLVAVLTLLSDAMAEIEEVKAVTPHDRYLRGDMNDALYGLRRLTVAMTEQVDAMSEGAEA